ncbi:outer membrane protein transport protein, partial [bacterium]|nr:outer membrane protein transport protein [bacterium]
ILLSGHFGVGARAMGMGGAAIAVSDDFSALYWNPAALAQVRRIEISGGLSHQRYTCRTTYYGNDAKDRESNTRLNAIGMVFPVPTYRGSLVFALGAGRDRNFDAIFVQRGYSTKDNWWQEGREIQSGGLLAWSVGGAVDVSPTLSLGAAINLWDGDYNYDWDAFFADTRDIWTEWPNDYDTTYIHDVKSADFDGVGIKLGGLLRLSRFVKAGMTISSPVTYDISGELVMRIRDVFDDGDEDQYRETVYFQNEISTPWEFGFGMAWSVPTFLMAADLRYADWSQMKFNDQPLEDYQETLSLSVGGEYILPQVGTKIRAGYSSEPIAYTVPEIVEDREQYTLGVGFLVGQVMTLDLAWVHGTWKTSQSSLTEKDEVDRVFLSVAYRF